MKIAATKVFADYINKTAIQTGKKFQAELYKMSWLNYQMNFDIWTAAEFGDITKDKTVKIILVTYPDNYYCSPKYLTSYYLSKEFRARGVRTETELQQMIVDLLEV